MIHVAIPYIDEIEKAGVIPNNLWLFLILKISDKQSRDQLLCYIFCIVLPMFAEMPNFIGLQAPPLHGL